MILGSWTLAAASLNSVQIMKFELPPVGDTAEWTGTNAAPVSNDWPEDLLQS